MHWDVHANAVLLCRGWIVRACRVCARCASCAMVRKLAQGRCCELREAFHYILDPKPPRDPINARCAVLCECAHALQCMVRHDSRRRPACQSIMLKCHSCQGNTRGA